MAMLPYAISVVQVPSPLSVIVTFVLLIGFSWGSMKDIILDRLTTRRTCENPQCQAIYNVKSNPPKVEGICDKCGSKVIQREDETEEAISHRLETYNEKTAPLTGYYEKEGLLMTVNATSSDAVVKAIQDRLGS